MCSDRKREKKGSLSALHQPSFPHQDQTAPRHAWQGERGHRQLSSPFPATPLGCWAYQPATASQRTPLCYLGRLWCNLSWLHLKSNSQLFKWTVSKIRKGSKEVTLMKVNQLESFSWHESRLKPYRILSGAFHATPVNNDGLRSYAQLPTVGLCHTWAKKSITLDQKEDSQSKPEVSTKIHMLQHICGSLCTDWCTDGCPSSVVRSLTPLCHFSSTDGRKYSPLCVWFRATDAVSLIDAVVAVKNRTGSSALMCFFLIFFSLHQSCKSHKKSTTSI